MCFDIQVSTCFKVNNLASTWVMTVNFFCKCSKMNLTFKNAIKNWENVFSFLDKCIWNGSGKFTLTLHENKLLAVNLLARSPKLRDPAKKNLFSLNLAQIDEKVGWIDFSKGFISFWNLLACHFRKVYTRKNFDVFKLARVLKSITS